MSDNTIVLSSNTFEKEVLSAQIPVLVDFWASWCGPCRMLAPVVEELAYELDGKVQVCKLNIDEEMDIAVAYGVSSIPTLILFKEGKEAGRSVGLVSKEDIMKMIAKV